MKSMTGFGQSKFKNPDVEVDISIKAYNGRYLEIRCHLPREYDSMENEVKKRISKHLQRGNITVYISRRLSKNSKLLKVTPNKDLAKKWLDTYKSLGRALRLDSKVKLETIAQLPEVLSVETKAQPSKTESNQFFKALDTAVKNLDLERSREGRGLITEIKQHIGALEKVVKQVEGVTKSAQREIKERMKKRLDALKVAETIDPQRLAQEVALQVDKMDVTEEVARLKEHIKGYKQVVSQKGAKGKKLDFYTQELLREVNTIGSKSSIAKLNRLAVDAKSIIEKIREQVQNIE